MLIRTAREADCRTLCVLSWVWMTASCLFHGVATSKDSNGDAIFWRRGCLTIRAPRDTTLLTRSKGYPLFSILHNVYLLRGGGGAGGKEVGGSLRISSFAVRPVLRETAGTHTWQIHFFPLLTQKQIF